MNDDFNQRERLEELLFASTDNSLTDTQRDELNAMLVGNPDARRHAVDFLSFDALLAENLGVSDAARRYTAKSERVSDKFLRLSIQHKAWLALAASITILCGWFIWRNVPNGVSQVASVCVVQHASRATAWGVGDELHAGDWIRFAKGRVAVRFGSGAKLAVEGPAELQILSNNRASLSKGRATIRVPGKLKGFTLDTPAEQIVDLGTAFGVNVTTDGATSIAVFEGEIELRGERHNSGRQLLSAGESVKYVSSSVGPNEIPFQVGDYLQTWQASFGVVGVEGAMRIAKPIERAVPGKVIDGERLLIFPERESVELPAGYVVSATAPGKYQSRLGLKQQVALDGPSVVDSYLIQFNPGQQFSPESPRRFSGTLQFDRPVVGLLFRAAMLDESDVVFGLPAADFGGVFRRGINDSDEVTLAPDRRTLTVTFDVINGLDQIRVLVASNPTTADTN